MKSVVWGAMIEVGKCKNQELFSSQTRFPSNIYVCVCIFLFIFGKILYFTTDRKVLPEGRAVLVHPQQKLIVLALLQEPWQSAEGSWSWEPS